MQTQPDHVNNIEQVYIASPSPGAYRIEVYGYNVPDGPQAFSLAATPQLVACAPAGILTLDQIRYRCDSTVTVQVIDFLNFDFRLIINL